ncbi:uncharacterized protein LOC144707691 [Wolffia australiana]
MLHRAASNAYSWWWASHIRTKQSKWLDNNLQDVEVKVESVLKLIEEDGDSFAQKAEMYYRKRPELVKFVEDFYRAYRALAERYDHISGELHRANKALATVFPDQLQLPIGDGDEEEGDATHETTTAVLPEEDPAKETAQETSSKATSMAMSRDAAEEKIDGLLKGILVLQTEKEFVKTSYESSLAKYWDIERRMTDMQKEVCGLQDRYGFSMAIEDDEARALMAATALKTCEAALFSLRAQQKQFVEEASSVSSEIRVSRKKLASLKEMKSSSVEETPGLELQAMSEKIKEHFERASVEELAEKINELAGKIIALELIASSQTAQIRRLRMDGGELRRSLEEEKGGHGEKIRGAEKELILLESLERSIRAENKKLREGFSVACRGFIDLSERIHPADTSSTLREHQFDELREDPDEEEEEEDDDDDDDNGGASLLQEHQGHGETAGSSYSSLQDHQINGKKEDLEEEGVKLSSGDGGSSLHQEEHRDGEEAESSCLPLQEGLMMGQKQGNDEEKDGGGSPDVGIVEKASSIYGGSLSLEENQGDGGEGGSSSSSLQDDLIKVLKQDGDDEKEAIVEETRTGNGGSSLQPENQREEAVAETSSLQGCLIKGLTQYNNDQEEGIIGETNSFNGGLSLHQEHQRDEAEAVNSYSSLQDPLIKRHNQDTEDIEGIAEKTSFDDGSSSSHQGQQHSRTEAGSPCSLSRHGHPMNEQNKDHYEEEGDVLKTSSNNDSSSLHQEHHRDEAEAGNSNSSLQDPLIKGLNQDNEEEEEGITEKTGSNNMDRSSLHHEHPREEEEEEEASKSGSSLQDPLIKVLKQDDNPAEESVAEETRYTNGGTSSHQEEEDNSGKTREAFRTLSYGDPAEENDNTNKEIKREEKDKGGTEAQPYWTPEPDFPNLFQRPELAHDIEAPTIQSFVSFQNRTLEPSPEKKTKKRDDADKEEEEEEERSLNLQQLLQGIGLEGREKLFLAEYTSILRNYKETKRSLKETMAEIRAKDEEIVFLRAKLQFLESSSPAMEDSSSELDLRLPDDPGTPNAVEAKFRRDMDEILEENLEFWLRFSESFEKLQAVISAWRELQAGVHELGGGARLKSLEEIRGELAAWGEESVKLEEELGRRLSSLKKMEEEMGTAELRGNRAGKLNGEVKGMERENRRVGEEMAGGRRRAAAARAEVEMAMARARRAAGMVSPGRAQPHYQFKYLAARTKVPLRSLLLFGAKPKPKKPSSIFSCMNPALQKQYSDLAAALPP